MKKTYFLTLAIGAAGLLSTAIHADPLVNAGVAGVAVAKRDVRSDDEGNGGSDQYNFSGAYSLAVTDNMSAQVDVNIEQYSGLNDYSQDVKSNESYTLHASFRDPQTGLIGIYGGQARTDLNHYDGYEMDYWGVEGQYYLSNATVYLQLAQGDKTNSDGEAEGFVSGANGRAAFRYFINDDFMIQPSYEVGHSDKFIDSADEGSFNIREISAEMRLIKSMPLYGKVSFRESQYDSKKGENDSLDEVVYGVGVNYYFGTTSLKHNDRYGATLETPMLPIRANAFAELVD